MNAALVLALTVGIPLLVLFVVRLAEDAIRANREAREHIRRLNEAHAADELDVPAWVNQPWRDDRDMPARALDADELTESARLIDGAFSKESN